eukprot:CAMPEP_0202453732 /NCGR_PEP_ID=MMETSP1360-20130828/11638_1 /ASSEMBLY_ACC=CAM_ASM_000848 /TAXON_ID=515479 /ORGANISM="Licmophora paradoxa, Strain CCMP2313" /LENGTH=264 /DNA_ID=CAMNT_0049072901 /DNA_START=359 /DNA_END=1153 /DNA_ORIENTATION=+
MDWDMVTQRFEIWRFLTCFCYAGPFKFDTLISIYLLVSFSDRYERGGGFNTGAGGGTADYAFMMLFGAFSCIATKPLMKLFIPVGSIYSNNMIFMVLYVWSKRFPTAQSNIWGFPVKASYLPFVYVALALFTGGSYLPMVHGIAMGHFYYFLVYIVPQIYQKEILHTPQFLIDQFGVGEYRPQYGAPPAAVGQARPGGRHLWGNTGQRLGASGGSAPPTARGGVGSTNRETQQPQEQPQQRATATNTGGGGHNWGSGGHRLGSN